MQDSNIQSSEQSTNEFIAEIQGLDTSADAAMVPAYVSYSVSVGPEGAQCRGWITYDDQTKVFFLGKSDRRWGGGAGGGGLPRELCMVLPAARLVGQTGRYELKMKFVGGGLFMIVDRQPVTNPFPLPVSGWGSLDWGSGGTMQFSRG